MLLSKGGERESQLVGLLKRGWLEGCGASVFGLRSCLSVPESIRSERRNDYWASVLCGYVIWNQRVLVHRQVTRRGVCDERRLEFRCGCLSLVTYGPALPALLGAAACLPRACQEATWGPLQWASCLQSSTGGGLTLTTVPKCRSYGHSIHTIRGRSGRSLPNELMSF